jgi:hypothetical protein
MRGTCNPVIREVFRFLHDEFQYDVIHDEELLWQGGAYAFVLEYQGNDRRVHLVYDYKENFLDFTIIRGVATKFPNEKDQVNIRSFWQIFKVFEPQLELSQIQPNGQTCAEAARTNAELLKKYCSGILRGEEWIA